MRKTELPNCPQWLLDADTENENVTVENGVLQWHSGSFLGGDFLGGDFRGGDFLGGSFLGGSFWGGSFRGGSFWGGNFMGGDFLGGCFRGGNFWGGNFWGGDFRGGNFLGGSFFGEELESTPLVLVGLRWRVTVTPGFLTIGCQRHTHETWRQFSDAEIERMEVGALGFWREHREVLLALCTLRSGG